MDEDRRAMLRALAKFEQQRAELIEMRAEFNRLLFRAIAKQKLDRAANLGEHVDAVDAMAREVDEHINDIETKLEMT